MKSKKKKGAIRKPQVNDPQPDTDTIEAVQPEPEPFLERMYGSQSKWLIAFVLIFGCVIIFFQLWSFQFINFDDNSYIYGNPHVNGGLTWENIKWAFTAFHSANWHPITWLSHQLDSTLFGIRAGYHHLDSAFIHTVNSVLLFFTLRKLTGATWKSGIVAAIFAFHPAHVESVAWVSERKDVLSTLFFILTLWFYGKYAAGEKKPLSYFLVILCFALGLMSKPMLVTLPFVLFLLDLWPLERFKKFDWANFRPLLVEKLPLFALSAGSSVMTFFAQRSGGAVMALENLPVSSRVINAIISYAKYVVMLFYPVGLGGWYPYREEGFPLWEIAASAALLVGVTAFAVWSFYRKKYFLVGWLWFLGTLVPVIGLVQVGRQSHADRYTYLPFIGLSIAGVWLAAWGIEKLKLNKDLVSAAAILILIVLGVLCFRQVSFWRDNESFYKQTLAVTEKNYLFEQNYCQYLLESDRLEEAEIQCRNSIANMPQPYPNSFLSLGLIEMKKKNYEEALKDFEIASRLRPNDIMAFSNYINALIALDRFDEAAEKTRLMKESDIADEVKNPYLLPLYSQVSFGFAGKKEIAKAIEYARKAIALNENSVEQHANLGLLLYQEGNADEALAELIAALRINPAQADLQVAAGRIYLDRGMKDEAAAYFRKALEIDPSIKTAREYLDKMKTAK
jgi:tetratricopeptide (TPR) repeat protein